MNDNIKQTNDNMNDRFDAIEETICNRFDGIASGIDYIKSQKNKSGDVQVQKIDPSELVDPTTQTNKGKVCKKIYRSSIEVSCKPIDCEYETELAILGKLALSPQILKFYGCSEINNSKVLENLNVKLGNFGYAREVDGISTNLSNMAPAIVRWMAPELIKKYISNKLEKKVYTFNCEMFSLGMLLWELCYEKLPYCNWNMKQISDHVLDGKREKILIGKTFKTPNDNKIQLEFIQIIQDAWCHQQELRITITKLNQKLEELATKFPISFGVPQLFEDQELDFDGQRSEPLPNFDDNPEIPEIPEDEAEEVDDKPALIPLEEGTKMHQNKKYKDAWECFKQNAELDNPVAKFWLGYYLFYGHHGEKDPIQAKKYFKEAADENNHADSQCRYAVLLLADLPKVNNEAKKKELKKEILHYFELAATDNRNIDAMYYLGDIYVSGKLNVRRDEERGLNYLKLAAANNNERAINLLKKLGKWNI
ncbi:2595_t:CDS:2 [Dentiscutata heterogama]|uniref:2595_t:CDS:1 n=1 Tax=Dentiscutata heterogama TaxID=1316150 RepID=A0ACA9LFY9_9GLOM|nr:2595_t:CDS:2 [Dentiscutata heterogama]